MQEGESMINVAVTWRGKRYEVEIDGGACLKDLGDELQKLTDVEADTMRLIVPQGDKSSKLVYPFSVEHSHLTLLEASISEGKPIRMMGVFKDEVDRILLNAKVDMRIAGFDEEGRRMRQRTSVGRPSLPKLPQGSYIFCDFRTLAIPGIELNPPPSEALKRMHMLAADPGIIAIMNKHRWRVGIMTEMAPIGYVGVSPKCILGFNKNQGEEISLRLRTDDLKGFRKYDSIKKTLLHELAHMVFSEHDADFYALDKQLNQEAATLDWTKAKGHTLSGVSNSADYEDDFDDANYIVSSQKLGGDVSDQMESARASSVAAAYRRLANVSEASEMDEPDPDDSNEPHPDEKLFDHDKVEDESDRDDQSLCRKEEPDPDDHEESAGTKDEGQTWREPGLVPNGATAEPDPDDSGVLLSQETAMMQIDEPEPDDEELRRIQDPVTAVCSRLTKAIQSLRGEVGDPLEASAAMQTLSKIIRNVIEHPNETKFRKIRKANPVIQKNIAAHKAAIQILEVAGFAEETVFDERGNSETYYTLKRNDPGLLWLAKSSLDTS
ncbi:DNA-dependent metalloprotease WSS1 homolog 2 [Linum grandiflorum]